MTREEKARYCFRELQYNCAQSVVTAFEDVLPLDPLTLLHAAAPFGGGMGRMRETCGTVSGALLVLGLMCAPDDPADRALKAEHYRLVQQFCKSFREARGSLVCRELLGRRSGETHVPEARTAAYYATRPCEQLVGEAARLLEQILAENSEFNKFSTNNP